MSETLRASLPPIYEKLLPPELDRPAIAETRATCGDCAMCDRGTMPSGVGAVYFLPDTKCCTFQPSIANFLVGSILRDEAADMAEGRARIEKRIASRVGVTPGALLPPNKYRILYRAAKSTSFGRSRTLQCPFFTEGGLCSIWRHREAVCSTFFCKYDGGVRGFAYWKALKTYLSLIEATLAVWAAKIVAPDVRQPPTSETLSPEDLEDRPVDDETYARTWGSWAGREKEFYVATANKVRNLSRARFAELVDESPKGKAMMAELLARHADLTSPRLSDRLALNRKMRHLPVANGVAVTAPYNRYDSMLLPPELFEVLGRLSHDEPLAETRKRLAEEEGIELADDLLVAFEGHRILVPPRDPSGEADGSNEP